MSVYDRLPDTRSRGREGERAAARYLESLGYRILARNVVTRAGEIDLVAEENGIVCFVEVKARREARHGTAASSVGRAKQRRLARSAALYLAAAPAEMRRCAVRFDVVGLERREASWSYELVRDAFGSGEAFLV